MSGKKIIDGLKAAVAGDFSRVTIEGQVWVRQRKWDEGEHEGCGIDSERAVEIERLRSCHDTMVNCLRWLDRKGGLGLDVHENIRQVLAHVGQEKADG